MGDADNALPPSKKRSAGRELTRDTPIDDEEDAPELETGTFKRASDEVLATRRIVKVRRQQTNSAPSSNPFAGIRLVAPTEPSANPAEPTTEKEQAGEKAVTDDSNNAEPTTEKEQAGEKAVTDDSNKSDAVVKDSEKAKYEEIQESETKTDEVEEKSAANKDAAEESNADKEHTAEKESAGDKAEADKEHSEDVNKSENEEKKEAASKESVNDDDKKENTDNGDKKDENAEEGGNLKSFQLLSSTQNAFTGLAGTGFSTSSFSFGSISSDKPFGLGLSTNGASVFGTSGASGFSKSGGSAVATMQEVVVETGEENEKGVFNADSVLFEFADGSWKERGKGEVKVNVTSGTDKARLLMRSRGNYRLILNARLYPDMKLTNMDKKGVTFACINSATEGKGGLSTFALKFKDVSIVEEFKAAIMAHKGGAATTSVLKTPENSPKASDD